MTRAFRATTPFVRTFVASLMPGRPALTFIARAAAEVWGVSEAELTGPSRSNYLRQPRQATCHLAIRKAAYGAAKVGRHLGGRHSSAAYHAASMLEAKIESDPLLRDRVSTCWSMACLLSNRHSDVPGREMSLKESRAYNDGIEAAARIAELWADECLRMADHTIKADPLLELSRAGHFGLTRDEIERAALKSAQLTDEGNDHAVRHHAAKDIAAMIRSQRLERVR